MRLHLVKKATLFLWLFIFPFLVHAQQSITGKVVSAKGNEPVAGISVLVKGTSTGTSSNAGGVFVIRAREGDILVLSGVGFERKEIAVTGSEEITVSLNESSNGLSEVVVTALGIKKEVKKLGYAVQEVKGEDLVRARDQNPVTGLTGKVAGLSVGASAELLRKPTVLLRGNEITLYVVDGIPISTDTWNISPDDIESYTVLKGPAAAALYGSRAQYGAILITTKKALSAKALPLNSIQPILLIKVFWPFPACRMNTAPAPMLLMLLAMAKAAVRTTMIMMYGDLGLKDSLFPNTMANTILIKPM